jgi:hypothetical protein
MKVSGFVAVLGACCLGLPGLVLARGGGGGSSVGGHPTGTRIVVRSGRTGHRNPSHARRAAYPVGTYPFAGVGYGPEPIEDLNEAPPPPPIIEPPSEPSLVQPLPTPNLRPPVSQTASGSLRFDVVPQTALVYVDGFYAGTTDSFAVSTAGLALGVGWHRLELRAPGFDTLAANVTIGAAQPLTFRAALRPILR